MEKDEGRDMSRFAGLAGLASLALKTGRSAADILESMKSSSRVSHMAAIDILKEEPYVLAGKSSLSLMERRDVLRLCEYYRGVHAAIEAAKTTEQTLETGDANKNPIGGQ